MNLTRDPYKILLLGQHNATRSIMAEHLLRSLSKGRFEVTSAGIVPAAQIHPLTARTLADRYMITLGDSQPRGLPSPPEKEYDILITVCAEARQAKQQWPRHRLWAHWGSPDPTANQATEQEMAWMFVRVASQIYRRAELFCAFPDSRLFDAAAVSALGASDDIRPSLNNAAA